MILSLAMENTRHTWLKDLFLLGLLITCFYAILLGHRPLASPDEGRYSEIPREMLALKDFVTPHLNFVKYFEKPPLFYWMQAASIKIFGVHLWSLRLATMIMGILGCLMTYSSARILYDRRTGWLASTVLATSLLYYIFARYITIDMTVAILIAGSLFSFILGTRAPPGHKRNLLMWAMYAFSALAVLAKGLIGLALPGMVIFFWLCVCNQWHELKTYCLPTGILLFLAIVLPWHVVVQLRNPEFFHFYFIDQQFLRYTTSYAGREQAFWFMPAVTILGIYPWTAFLFQSLYKCWNWKWRERKKYKTEIFFLLWIVLIFLFFWASQSQLLPYILPIFPAMALLIGHCLAQNWKKQSPHVGIKLGMLINFIIGSVLGIIGFIIHNYVNIPHHAIKYTELSAILLITGSLLALIQYLRSGLPRAFISMSVITALFFISINLAAPLFDKKSVYPLALTLKPILKPSDEVIGYHRYNQDLPVYIEHRITLVNWTNELSFGIQHQDTSDWMISDKTLWQRWHSPKRVFMIVSRGDYKNIKLNINPKHMYIIAQIPGYLLVSNKRPH